MTNATDGGVDIPLGMTDSSLILNARNFRYDARLDRVADLFHVDYEKWSRLPLRLQDAASIYADWRDYYRRAVAAGLIPDDRTPDSQELA